ncbi:TFIIB-type zinc ribbon-containing protein [Qaidamihabitans albus]|uniref:TFIIB-type zinc ribbon-containing protein n=1 Tax=Qaidamihabitans albus TaxID=2795733 RepID=UPI0018F16D1F|nr:zf-TFIIB domain-containing protein [Qaidamihabitans albus]
MICPKCQNLLKTVDKSGIHIEQCEGCRGIFLDRGELEQIVNAENAYYAQAAPAAPPPYQPAAPPPPGYQGGPPPPPPPAQQQPYGGYGYKDSPRPYRGGGYKDSPRPYRHQGQHGQHGYRGNRKRSFLENLFD